MTEREIPLTGGRVTSGVVRVGETVRRPLGSHSPFVHALLRHYEVRGVEGVPRFLGIDERGREILTFLPGDVPSELGHFSDAQLGAAARLLRRLHDAAIQTEFAERAGAPVLHREWAKGCREWVMRHLDAVHAGAGA